MECSRIMLIVFVVTTITAVLTEFNTTTVITARRPTLVLKSKNEWKTKPPETVNANSEERGKWRTRGVTTTTIFQRHLETEKIPTTDIPIKSTKNEQENLSYSAVTLMYSADPTNSSLARNNSTTFSHDPDNSEHIVTIVGITVSLLVVVTVVGLLFLCYYNRLLCFKRKTKRDLDNSSSPMLDEDKIKTQDTTVDGDAVSMVEFPMSSQKNKSPDRSGDEDTVDIKTEDEKYPVRTKDKPIIKSFNNIQPSDAGE